jgi:hypothetical protein
MSSATLKQPRKLHATLSTCTAQISITSLLSWLLLMSLTKRSALHATIIHETKGADYANAQQWQLPSSGYNEKWRFYFQAVCVYA